MNKSEIHKYLLESGLHPNKKLGQNFLVNETLSGKIADKAEIVSRPVLEIGPGLGSLTEFLVQKASHVTAVEIDSGICSFLRKRFKDCENIEIVHSDFLKYQPEMNFYSAVGNLPYYCSSEIIFHVIETCSPEIMVFMLQKEMADRLVSRAGDKNYGALSASVALYYSFDSLFHVDKFSFYPVPDVTSTVIRLVRNNSVPDKKTRELFHLAVKSAFWGKRKTIFRSLSDSPFVNFNKDILVRALDLSGLDMKLRAENITTEKFLKLAENLKEEIENGI